MKGIQVGNSVPTMSKYSSENLTCIYILDSVKILGRSSYIRPSVESRLGLKESSLEDTDFVKICYMTDQFGVEYRKT